MALIVKTPKFEIPMGIIPYSLNWVFENALKFLLLSLYIFCICGQPISRFTSPFPPKKFQRNHFLILELNELSQPVKVYNKLLQIKKICKHL